VIQKLKVKVSYDLAIVGDEVLSCFVARPNVAGRSTVLSKWCRLVYIGEHGRSYLPFSITQVKSREQEEWTQNTVEGGWYECANITASAASPMRAI